MKMIMRFWTFLTVLMAASQLTPSEFARAQGPTPAPTAQTEMAIFGGGCFWCMEAPFDSLPGVKEVLPGYTGGTRANPTYEEVSSGSSGHVEVVRIVFDPKVITYAQLLEVFWHQIDPLTPNAQFCDKGSQYRSAIFYTNEEQKKAAEASRTALEKSGVLKGKIVTELGAASPFYTAEEYHRQYYKKNPIRYAYYRKSCGRDAALDKIWGKDRKKPH